MPTASTIDQLVVAGTHYISHTASRRGYLSRQSSGTVERYKGRYGEGYILVTPRRDTTLYVGITYYIKK